MDLNRKRSAIFQLYSRIILRGNEKAFQISVILTLQRTTKNPMDVSWFLPGPYTCSVNITILKSVYLPFSVLGDIRNLAER
jgi:hypothetical protein